jgi:hypothetical protein
MIVENKIDEEVLYAFMKEKGMTNIRNKKDGFYRVDYMLIECMCQVRWMFYCYELILKPIHSVDHIGNGAGGMIKFTIPNKPKELPIEDTTILSPNEVIKLYRKVYREGYMTPSMFLEKLNELVKEKLNN